MLDLIKLSVFPRVRPSGRYSKLSVALVADTITQSCLEHNCTTINLTPGNFRRILKSRQPDLLFVESAWTGHRESWKYHIADYPDHPDRNNAILAELADLARELKIPSVFWNKEDGVHFERFIESAKHFDHVFTVDENCIPAYRERAPQASVSAMMFAVEPAIHNFTGFDFRHRRANFTGSYSHHIHERRRQWQNMLFDAACSSGFGLTVFDRNSNRRSPDYRYPEQPGLRLRRRVAYRQTAQIYKDYLVSLNVNTIEDSPTMFSRRIVEILACGGIAATSPSPSIDKHFREFVHVLPDSETAHAFFGRLTNGPSPRDLDMARAGADYVAREHTWQKRLEQIDEAVRF